jgi:hypothetical protein
MGLARQALCSLNKWTTSQLLLPAFLATSSLQACVPKLGLMFHPCLEWTETIRSLESTFVLCFIKVLTIFSAVTNMGLQYGKNFAKTAWGKYMPGVPLFCRYCFLPYF